ncbi:MAG TPA: MFS transporter [Streptosporangiaceae bacterium]|nr:MFS transporter [Streptosporangiaceae bacterium]
MSAELDTAYRAPVAGAPVAGAPIVGDAMATPERALRPATAGASLSAVGLACVLIGVLLPMVDFFIVNVALASIDQDLHASAPLLELVVSAYATAYALLLVVGGRLGDSFGRRRLFLAGMAAFAITSAACGLAPSAITLVAARAAQGASATLMVPQVLATIQSATAGQQRARALARYGATGGIAAVIGQLLGGLLVSANLDGTGWRPIFLVNVPIGIAGFVLARRYMPVTRAAVAARVDGPGTLLLGVLVLTLLIPLTEGRSLHWPAWAIVLLAASPAVAAALTVVEARAERAGRIPFVPPSLIRLPTMRQGLTLALPFFAGFGAFMFCYPLAVQQGLGASPLAAGQDSCRWRRRSCWRRCGPPGSSHVSARGCSPRVPLSRPPGCSSSVAPCLPGGRACRSPRSGLGSRWQASDRGW